MPAGVPLSTAVRAALLLAAGGALGTLARFGVSRWIVVEAGHFPTATLAVNLGGSFLLGLILGWFVPHHPAAGDVRLGLAVGFCGAFTTMSTFAFETVSLAQHGAWGTAAAYVLGSVAGGILAAFGGLLLGARLA